MSIASAPEDLASFLDEDLENVRTQGQNFKAKTEVLRERKELPKGIGSKKKGNSFPKSQKKV